MQHNLKVTVDLLYRERLKSSD